MSSTVASVNDILDEDEGGLSGFTILAILATLLMVFVLVVYYAYRQGVARASSFTEELPVVAADPTPVAEDVPLDVARTERQEVYDRVSGALPTRTVTFEDPERDALNGYGSAPSKLSSTREEASADKPRIENPLVTAMADDQPVRRTTTPTPSQKPANTSAKRAQTATSPAPVPARSNPAPAALGGTHVVQVGAFDSNAAAIAFYEGMRNRFGTLMSSKQPDVQRAEVGGRTYHRLRVGPFTSKADASAYCQSLKARSQDCLVRGV
ncbi:MAG: SPOR domain-containing protein [Pseudomonadota bacterium]